MTNVKEFSDNYYITEATVIGCGEKIWNKFRAYVLQKGLVIGKGDLMAYWDTMCFHYSGVYDVVLSKGHLFWRIRPSGETRVEYTMQDILTILHYHGFHYYPDYGHVKQEEPTVPKFKAMKFRVKDEEHSAHIQKYLFSLGYKWYVCKEEVAYTDSPFIYTKDDGFLLFGEMESLFSTDTGQEYALDVHTTITYICNAVEKPRATIELNGVSYYVDELEKALQHIKPVESA